MSEAVVPVDDPLNVAGDVVDDTTHLDDTMQVDVPIDIPVYIPTPFPSVGSNDENQIKAAQEWENTITGVGQRFNSVHEFREALRKYSVAHQFALVYKKNESERVTVKCKGEGCPWRIHASRLGNHSIDFVLRK